MAEERPPWLIPFVMFLNISVLILNNFLKFQQVTSVMSSKTSSGPKVVQLLIELWVFSNLYAYPSHKGYHIVGYLEFILMTAQVSILIFLTLRQTGSLSVLNFGAYGAYMAFIYQLARGLIPLETHAYFVYSVIFLIVLGRFMILRNMMGTKSQGTVTLNKWILGVYAPAAKLTANLLTVRDPLLMAIPAASIACDMLIGLAAMAYGGGGAATTKKDTKKKQ